MRLLLFFRENLHLDLGGPSFPDAEYVRLCVCEESLDVGLRITVGDN
jgi:hypothetical protein